MPLRTDTQEIFLEGSADQKVIRLIEKFVALVDRLASVEKSVNNLASRTSQLNTTANTVKTQMTDLRPDVRSARDEMSEVTGRMLAMESKVVGLEKKTDILITRPHDCFQEAIINDVREETKVLRTDIKQATEKIIQTATALEKGAEPAVLEIKAARQRFFAVMFTVVFALLAAVGGWVATLSALRKDVQHLRDQQQSVESEVTKSRLAIDVEKVQRDKQLRRLEKTLRKTNADEVGFAEWYGSLSVREKNRVRRIVGEKRLPVSAREN